MISLAELEARIVEVYDKAQSEVAKQAADYFVSFKDRYDKEYAAYEEGKYTPQQFQVWYFALVDEITVKKLLMSEKLDILLLNLDIDESERWNARQQTNALTSGIIRGQNSGKIADEFQRATNMDCTSALRNVRTATTGAQNSRRQEIYDRAAEMGIEIEKEWIATEDIRTRESHAETDVVRVKYNATFPNGLEYPGDPFGSPEEVYNCCCTVRAIIPKYNGDQSESHIEGYEGRHTKESYKEWIDRKREKKMKNSKHYTHADAMARGMAAVEERRK